MTLLTSWKEILQKAWSMRLMALAAFLSGGEAILDSVGANWLPLPDWARLLVIFVVIAGAFVTRLLVQKNMPDE